MKIRGIDIGKWVYKVAAGVLTFMFLKVVRPDANATITDIGIAALLLYEGFRFSIEYIIKMHYDNWKYKKTIEKLRHKRQMEDEMYEVAGIDFRRIAS